MDWIRNIFVCLLCGLQLVVAFNVDSESWKSFSQNKGSAFGYKIIQQPESLIISDPLVQNQNSRGSIYSCNPGNSVCSKVAISVPSEAINISLGLSMSQDSSSSNIITCGPTIPKDCKELTTYNGMCFTIKDNTYISGPFPSTLRDCPISAIDIAFLMDGSGSVHRTDFSKMKNFIITLIQGLQGRDFRFAVAQFSQYYDLPIPFTDKINTANINSIRQMGSMTYTGSAINQLVNEFVRSGRQSANRILVVITDGQSNGGDDLQRAANNAAKNNIIRYAIGVGNAFTEDEAQRELNTIASDPDSQYVFKVQGFDVLNQILNTLRANIIAIEGTNTGESAKLEFAQDGFDAVFAPDGTKLMSAVGAFQWKGGYFNDKVGFLMGGNIDSYSGYSMKVAKTIYYTYVILGAPRDDHKGQVIISELNYFSNITKSAPEPQIGAYFGAELCVVDLNMDKISDLLLVSAPLHIDDNQEGKVFVYFFSQWPRCIEHFQTLKGIPGQRGRFGLALSSPADLNGDGYGDVVIGAPMEENGQGSIYIFNGRIDDINPIYSQRITGSSVNPRLRFFGFSLSQSAVDNSGDTLPDLAVGSKGEVNIFRTRPIVSLETTVTYTPSKIPTILAECRDPVSITLQLCFTMTGHDKVKTDLAADIDYTLKLDSKRQSFRASFSQNERLLSDTIQQLGLAKKCKDHSFSIEACPKDALNPLTTEVTFTFRGRPSIQMGNLRPLLLPSIKTTSDHNLDFEIDCGPDKICIDDIRVDFNFSGVSEILVGIMLEMNVTVSVKNRGENSYNNRIILKYPFGLSFRRFTIKQGRVECTSLDTDTKGSLGETSCFINKPIFKTNAEAVFEITYSINKESNYEKISLNLKAYSDNDNHAINSVLETTQSIDVKYGIHIAFIRHENTSIHINFTAGKSDLQKPVQQILKVTNEIRDLNFTIFIRVPVKIGDKNIWTTDDMQIAGCVNVRDEKPNITDFAAALKTKPELNCSVAVCRVFQCDAFFLKRETKLYSISGNVSSQWIGQTGLRSAVLELVSTATLEYDKTKYVYFSFDSRQTSPIGRMNTQVEVYEEKFPLKETIGGVVAGIVLLALITAALFKAGFFKSNYGKMLEEAGAGGDTAAEPGPGPSNEYNE